MNQGGYGGGTGGGGDYSYGGGYADHQTQQQYNNNPYASSNDNEHQHQQYYHQQQDDQQQQYYPPAANDGYYGGGEEQHQQYNAQYDSSQYDGEYNTTEEQHVDPNSPFYPTSTPFVPHPNDTPDNYGNYNTQGDPISAIAVDLEGEISSSTPASSTTLAPALLYVASHTSVQREKRTGLQHPANAGQIRTRTTRNKDFTLDRGSRLSVLYNDTSTTNDSNINDENVNNGGDKTIYSTFVAHPEASPNILNGLHSILYNGAAPLETTNSSSSSSSSSSISRGLGNGFSSTAKARPSHAYGPPYGPASYTHHCSTNLFSAILSNNNNAYRPEDKYCMGISSIFSVSTPYFGSGGRLCSISPYGVRVHTRGGMIMSSKCNLLQGMTCGELVHGTTCANVCGISYSDTTDDTTAQQRAQHVHCIDLNRDCKIVSSHTLVRTPKPGEDSSTSTTTTGGGLMCVTDMATNHERNNIIVGCSDGSVRVLDGGRRNAEVAKARGQTGGIAKVDVMENLIVASGYSNAGVSSPSSPLPYPYPAPHVLIYDVRYLGRGGIPHMTSPRGGARFVNFLPDGNVLVGSGQTYGCFEIITPFDKASTATNMFFQPELNAGESMSTVELHEGELYIGTSYGRVLQYGLTSYDKTIHSTRTVPTNNEALDMPPFVPSPPELSIDPTILCSSNSRISSTTIFDSYVMASNPLLSSDKSVLHPRYSHGNNVSTRTTTLGPMSRNALVPPSKRWLSNACKNVCSANRAKTGNDMNVLPSVALGLGDLLSPIESNSTDGENKGYKGKKGATFNNPNKLIYSEETFAKCYDATANPRKKAQAGEEEDYLDGENIPERYRLMVRPPFYKVTNFDFSQFNGSGVFSGWDYAPNFNNSFACSVLTLLYFIEEIRTTALQFQLSSGDLSIQAGVSVTAELGLLFNFIESLSANGMIQPSESNQTIRGQVKAFVPSNFISAFALLPEAKNLALIDGVAGAAELARRPEAFYRFLVQYIEKELGKMTDLHNSMPLKPPESINQGDMIDQLQGIKFLSVIEYHKGHGKPKISSSRALTVDLAYGYDVRQSRSTKFSQILRTSLCKEAPMRAWSEETSAYKKVVQRKIATSLPSLLSLSCCCAGRRVDAEGGLQFWQQEDSRNWLPEFIDIQIETGLSITVKELAVVNDDGAEEWYTSEQLLPESFYQNCGESFWDEWKEYLPQNLPMKKSYRLEAVISFIRTSSDESTDASQSEGHHIVHVRVPADFEAEALTKQLNMVEKCLAERNQYHNEANRPITLVSGTSLEERKQHLVEEVQKLKEREAGDQWFLINGFAVTKVEPDDVRSFNSKFREPSIVLYREITDAATSEPKKEPETPIVPKSAMTKSYNGSFIQDNIKRNLPSKGDLVAIDAEFVCVQQEESLITSSGSKEMTCEARNALARLSIVECQSNEVIVDNYILPREPVVDYLTRFSGIHQGDLDPDTSPHRLVTPQEAYLKVRLLMENGCIFVGHGLSQDFRVINICIPPNQIIDTAEIFHQPNQRYISLRYLTNYVLGRDMQQEVHDSIEDAKAAYELYNKALELKKAGKFEEYLMQLYAHGHKTQFKLGVATPRKK